MVSAEELQELFGGAEDVTVRRVSVCTQELILYYIDGVCSGGDIAETVLRPLSFLSGKASAEGLFERAKSLCYNASMVVCDTAEQAAQKMAHGYCALLFPGQLPALCFEVKTSVKRGPDAPESESTVKGARDCFVETIRINTSLVRRHLRSTALRFVKIPVGSRTDTSVLVCYLDDLTNLDLVERMKARLEQIDIDGLLSPAAVEEYVTGSRRTAFPLLDYTERTDKFCQGLLNGQVGLLIDGMPLGYLAPVSFAMLMESPEDRAVDYISATSIRVLRYAALFVSLLFPALYAGMAMFHQEMIPTKLLLAIIESKQEVPFPTILEVLGLLAAFELLQEAGLHLPQAIGTAVSIIGGLAVGTAAVDARLVSPAALIVTASSGICGFTLPNRDLSDAIRIWRFGLTVLAGLAGLFGVAVGMVLLLIHLGGLSSLDVPYLEPFCEASGGKALQRPLLKTQKFRNHSLHPQDERKQA